MRECSCFSDPVFETIGVPALFAAQVDEVVCGSGRILWGHVPHDAERVTGHLADLDVARCGKRGVHFCHLPLEVEINVRAERKHKHRHMIGARMGRIYLKTVTEASRMTSLQTEFDNSSLQDLRESFLFALNSFSTPPPLPCPHLTLPVITQLGTLPAE